MLTALSIIKLITEIAGMALVGQLIVGLLAGAGRSQNFFYMALASIGQPFVSLARLISPKIVLTQHLPLVALLIVFFIWLAVTLLKIQTCLSIGVALCQ